MNPTWSRLSLASSSGPASTVERPPKRTVPRVGVRMHPRIDNSVVLPLPDGPINSVNSPRLSAKLTPLRAWTFSIYGRARVRACARYGVLVVGEEMKGLVNCNFLPGSARRLELGTVSPEPLSRAYWSQKLRPLGETVGLSRARTSGESPDSTQAGRGPQWPIQLAAISAHPAAMVGTGMPKLRGRTGNEAIAMPTAPSLERDSAAGRRTPGN